MSRRQAARVAVASALCAAPGAVLVQHLQFQREKSPFGRNTLMRLPLTCCVQGGADQDGEEEHRHEGANDQGIHRLTGASGVG